MLKMIMTDSKSLTGRLEQWHHENLSWLRSLEFFKQENAFMKNRLAHVVDKTSDHSFLANAEHFQNQFIIKDELIDQLNHDVKKLEKRITDYFVDSEDPNLVEGILSKQEHISDQVQYLEKDFTRLRSEFNQYLLKIS